MHSGLVLPAFAPKEIRFIGSDISMLGKAVLQKKAPIHRLFWALSIEKEAETMLDERETSQRHKAITFAYKVYPGFLGMMLGHLFFAQHPVNNIAIIYFIVFGLAVHAVIPAAYLVWNYKPLETEFET